MDETESLSEQTSNLILDSLPPELTNEILLHLGPHDLTKLARTSKKYREFAQSELWRNIELHRQDAHDECFGLSQQRNVHRAYLDNQLRDPWSYRRFDGVDPLFDRRNALFGTAVRTLFRAAGKSKAWKRLAPFVRHLCLTVTYKSPQNVWDMILSLENLNTIEIIGEWSADNQGPRMATSLREPAANKISSARLRGYISQVFVLSLCKSSASSIATIDFGILEAPQVYEGDAEEMELQTALGYPLYVAPRGVQWYKEESDPPFTALTHLLLCRQGPFYAPLEMSDAEDFESREDPKHEAADLKQWASLLRSVRATVEEIVLEQRPIRHDFVLNMGNELSPHERTMFHPEYNDFDSRFYHIILKDVFGDGAMWPKLKRLTLRGINLQGIEDEAGEDLQTLMTKMLPGIRVELLPGNFMYFNTRKGTIMNQHGADGLKPHLDMDSDSFDDGMLFL
jgi:hypothetical protein